MEIEKIKKYSRYDVKGIPDFIPNKKYHGINGYSSKVIGWLLSKLGFAFAVTDENKKTFYLNRKSTIHWLNRHERGPLLADNTSRKVVIDKLIRCVNHILHQPPPPATEAPKPIDQPNPPLKPSPWEQFDELPEEIRQKIYSEIPDKNIGKLAQVSKKMEETTSGQALVRRLKVYLESRDEVGLKQFLAKNHATKLSWDTVSKFSLEDKWQIFSLFIEMRLLIHPLKYKLIATLANEFLAEKDFRFLNLKFPKKKEFLQAFNRCCLMYANNLAEYGDFLPSCYERLERRYPGETFFQQLSVHYKAYKVLQWINTLPEEEAAQRIREQGSSFLQIVGDTGRTFVKAIIDHLLPEKYPFFFCLNIPRPQIKTVLLIDLNPLDRDKWRALCKEILKTHNREDSQQKLQLGEATLLCFLVMKIETKEDLQIAIESIPQDATPDQRRWYLQALTRGLSDWTIIGNPQLPQEEIQALLDEMGLVVSDQQAKFDEQYDALFKVAHFAD